MKKIASSTFIILGIGLLGFPSLSDLGSITSSKLSSRVSAGVDIVKAASIDDEDIANYASQYAAWSDKKNKLAPEGSSYAERLKNLTGKLTREDGLKLNFKAYINPDVNAFSLANGTIRVNSGLLDKMTDDEVLSVIGHEIGHIKLGHSKARFRTAYLASAARKGATSAVDGPTGTLVASELGGLGEALIKAQFSQSNEKEADDYGFAFMTRHKLNQQASISALSKIGGLGSKSSIFSSHPDSKTRADRLKSRLK